MKIILLQVQDEEYDYLVSQAQANHLSLEDYVKSCCKSGFVFKVEDVVFRAKESFSEGTEYTFDQITDFPPIVKEEDIRRYEREFINYISLYRVGIKVAGSTVAGKVHYLNF